MDQSETKYFDLHIDGLGYLNRAREITPKRGEPFLAVDISALHGSAEDVQYTRFDCRVTGKDAQDLVRILMPDIEGQRKVLIGFRLSDLYAETFTYQSGERTGETGISLKARLLRIKWARVDGVSIYGAPEPPADTQAA